MRRPRRWTSAVLDARRRWLPAGLVGGSGRRARPPCCERTADLYEEQRRRTDRDRDARGRQDRWLLTASPRCARRWTFLRYYAARAERLEVEEPRQRAASSSASAPGTFRWRSSRRPDRRGAGGRQRRDRQARRTDAADRRPRGRTAASGRPAQGGAATPARRRPDRGRAADLRCRASRVSASPARPRSPRSSTGPGAERRPGCAADRRDRRPERDDRRFNRADRAGGARHPDRLIIPEAAGQRCSALRMLYVQEEVASGSSRC